MSEMELGSRDDVVTKADIEHTLKGLSFQKGDTILPKIMTNALRKLSPVPYEFSDMLLIYMVFT